MASHQQAKKPKAGNRKVTYSAQEVYDLVVAYSSISEDGDIGPDQDADVFWERVHAIHVVKYAERTVTALKRRWNQHIGPEMRHFSGIVMRYKRQARSGAVLEDDLDEAQKDFKVKFKHEIPLEAWKECSKMARYTSDPGTYESFVSSKLPIVESRNQGRQRAAEAKALLAGENKKLGKRSPTTKKAFVGSKSSVRHSTALGD